MLEDTRVIAAISNILQRSERQDDPQKILESFVDVGILPQLQNFNNQILFGRRGTGKTHVLRVLGTRLQNESNTCVVYIDSRSLGSTAQFSDNEIPIRDRCLALFRDILSELVQRLRKFATESDSSDGSRVLEAINSLTQSALDPVKQYREESLTARTSSTANHSFSFEASSNPSLASSSKSTKEMGYETTYMVETKEKIFFPTIQEALREVLQEADCRLWILLDEWSSLPQDIQPYLAEFLKRAILPVRRIVIKIASLEYRSRFSESSDTAVLGFELGADIATAPELDDYYVYDRNQEQILELYENILHRHLTVELPENYLREKHRISSGTELVGHLFTGRSVFQELSRAAEGVVRDLLNIFTLACFDANRRRRPTLDRSSVTGAARQWFEQDKSQLLDDEMHEVLRSIVNEVIGRRKARSFLVPRELERHRMIQKLFDARVLHLVQRGYADKDNPGQRYNIYAVDYGTYVDLLGTSSQPQLELELFVRPKSEGNQLLVPFDDKRSIRQIILSREHLETANGRKS